jgi:pantothenate kinase
MRMRFQVQDAGFKKTVRYTENTVKKVFLPFIEDLADSIKRCDNRPFVIGMAGPPGSGKSALCDVFSQMLESNGVSCTVLPMDGFHLETEDLKKKTVLIDDRRISLHHIKGAKETYDVHALLKCLEKLEAKQPFYWPVYLRTIHEPVKHGIDVSRWDTVYIVEGNYLFIDHHPWNLIAKHFLLKMFILPKLRFLKSRLIARKRKGGFSRNNARSHYRCTDSRNIREVCARSTGYDVLIEQRGKYAYRIHLMDHGLLSEHRV